MLFSLIAVLFITATNPDSAVVSAVIPDSTILLKSGELKDSLPVYRLKGMVVTATRTPLAERSAPASVSVIEPDPLTPNLDAANRLSQTAGASLGGNGGIGSVLSLSIRGAATNQVLYLLDGLPVNSAQNGSYDLNRILSQAQRIEIVRGPASSLYGANAVAGVVNIITKDSKQLKPYSRINFEKGGYSSQVWEATVSRPLAKWASASMGATWKKTGGQRVNSDYDGTNYFLELFAQPYSRIETKLRYQEYKSQNGVPGSVDYPSPTKRQKDWGKDFSFKASYDQNSFVALSRNSIENMIYSTVDSRNYTLQTNVEGQYQHSWMPQINTTVGVGYQMVESDITDVGQPELKHKAAFLIQQVEPLKDLLFVGSARYDKDFAYQRQISPSLSINYGFFEYLNFYTSYGQSFRAPTLNDLYWYSVDNYYGTNFVYSGNDSLLPEKNAQFEIGLKLGTIRTNGTLCFYRSKTTNLIDWGQQTFLMPDTLFTKAANIGKTITQGVELQASHTLFDMVTLDLNYTYCLAVQDTIGRPGLPFKPQHIANGSVTINDIQIVPDLKLGWKFWSQYSDIQKAGNWDPVDNLPAYIISNHVLSLKIADARVYYKVENLFNANYQTRYGYPMPRRTQSFGVTLELWD
ncbi:TonB-dependent receptor [candidate division TA06 bacterium]|uniref:TonB-dependent receptor n=1 Tax=candidate division TA06 bacterium TaxID=2250710 RepID=A0A933MK47_UNCT6|nr:TonB-dependent receptor [candidate division TA06 bacterium]